MIKPRLSDSPGYYRDCEAIFDLVLERREPLIYSLTSSASAIQFRQKCNQFRQMLRQRQADLFSHIPGRLPETPYDAIRITFFEPDERRGRNLVGPKLRFATYALEGVLTDSDGNIIDLNLAIGEPEDEDFDLDPEPDGQDNLDFNFDPRDL